MFTDIVGYTTLMGKDEARALALLKCNKVLHQKLLKQYNGKWLKEMGDGVLMSFQAVTDAVYFAGHLLKDIEEVEGLNRRIGLHLGEITIDEGEIHGDGVNIASRLEGLAEGGQILISESVYQNIKNNKAIESTFLGEKELKNISEPVRVYSAIIRKLPEKVAFSGQVVSEMKGEGNSIAVLPFTNMSSDLESEYFADGLTEEILNSIAQIKELKVVGRTSSFQFKGKNIDLRDVGEKLNVSTILEGSIRKQGTRIRVTAQLIKVEDGYHIWSERFDRELNDIFEIQEQIAISVVERIKKDFATDDKKNIKKRYTDNPEIYNQYLMAKFYFNKRTPDGLHKALEILERIVRKNPDYGPVYAIMADCYRISLIGYGDIPREIALKKLKESSQKALEFDPDQESVHASLGHTYLMIEWDLKKSKEHLEKALALNPNSIEALQWFGWYYITKMEYQKSSEYLNRALNLDPLSAILNTEAGWPYAYSGDLENAEKCYKKAIEIDPSYALTYFDLGNVKLNQGKEKEGFALIEKAIDSWGEVSFFLGLLGHYQARFGETEKAKKTLEALMKQHKDGLSVAFSIADVFEGMGNVNETLKWLNIAYDQKEPMMVNFWPWRSGHLQSDLLKDHPGLYEIMKKVGLTYS